MTLLKLMSGFTTALASASASSTAGGGACVREIDLDATALEVLFVKVLNRSVRLV